MSISPKVIAVSKSRNHTLSKNNVNSITLVKRLGVDDDAHMGKTVKHRSRIIHGDPTAPNLRQVHIIHSELFDDLAVKGFDIIPGQMGENITSKGVDLLSLPKNTIMKIGNKAKIEVTGLRNPCAQLDSIYSGLMRAVLTENDLGKPIPLAGIMGIVIEGGKIGVDDSIEIELPEKPFQEMTTV